MRLALIQCVTLPPRLTAPSGDIPQMFDDFFNTAPRKVHLDIYDARKGDLPDPDAPVDGFIFPGSTASVYDGSPWIGATLAFIRTLFRKKKKILGVCFGHQLIAQALGGSVAKSPKGWGIGVQAVSIHRAAAWMDPLVNTAHLMVSYQDQVQKLPPGATLLAGNAHCDVFMFSIQDQVWGIQGHPEFTRPFARALYQSREKSLGKAAVAHAVESLDQIVDQALWARWICQFFDPAPA